MALIQKKWYSWGAALAPRTQAMIEGELDSMSGELAPATSVLTGCSYTFRKECDPAGPQAGHTESLRIRLSVAEIERMYAWYQELKAKYGVMNEKGEVVR